MLTIHNFFAGEKNVLAVVIFHRGNDHSRPDNSDGRAALAKASRNNGYDVANVTAPKEPP